MRVLCAPDSFKGSLSATAAAEAMAAGLRRLPQVSAVDLCPIADGGEGSLTAVLTAQPGQRHSLRVTGPLGAARQADWGELTAGAGPGGASEASGLIEMAQAAGLTLLPEAQRDPLRSTSYGCGELLAAALDRGLRRILLFVGGSATHDGGCGAAQALGVRFLDTQNMEIPAPLRGADLPRIARIDASDRHPGLEKVDLWVCCDVRSPLCGPDGAAAVFALQKGAQPGQLETLDANLAQLARIWRRDLGQDVAGLAGSGAAGGMGGGAVAMLGAQIRPGIAEILELCRLDARLARADLCLTGEGRFDAQTATGKACQGVAARARAAGVPCLGFFGSIHDDAPAAESIGLAQTTALADGLPLATAMRRAGALLSDAVAASVGARC